MDEVFAGLDSTAAAIRVQAEKTNDKTESRRLHHALECLLMAGDILNGNFSEEVGQWSERITDVVNTCP